LKVVRFHIRGVVQGVGFRHFVVTAARRHGVRGWVRNLDDGSVEVVAERPPKAFVDDLRRGPAWARVERVVEDEIDAGPLGGFDVRS